jgi:hypothetical protein
MERDNERTAAKMLKGTPGRQFFVVRPPRGYKKIPSMQQTNNFLYFIFNTKVHKASTSYLQERDKDYT